jgi:diguanylate cyclase (GGDEF)-like protein
MSPTAPNLPGVPSWWVDELTGLWRRWLVEPVLAQLVLERRAPAFEPVALPLGFLYGDVDHLRDLNKAHGYPKCDELLIAIAGAIARALPEGALLFRVGGDELLILLPQTDVAALGGVAEQVLTAVRRTSVAESNGNRFGGTISLGGTTIDTVPKELRSASDINSYLHTHHVRPALDALQRAKHSGGDHFCRA